MDNTNRNAKRPAKRDILRTLFALPDGYLDACYDTKAIVRKRVFASPNDLLLLACYHLLNGSSLLDTAYIAEKSKIGSFSDVAFLKKFEKCNAWFQWISSNIVTEALISLPKPAFLSNYSVIGVDASDIVGKGPIKSISRLHYALDLFTLRTVQQKITTEETGESLTNFDFHKKDLVVGDRIYSTHTGIKHCMNCGADFILRLRSNSFIVYDVDGTRIDLLSQFGKIDDEMALDISGYTLIQGKKTEIRICARRKTESAIKENKAKYAKKASRKQKRKSDYAKGFNEYIVVVTGLPTSITADDILETYRVRWEIEIAFKRLKSLLDIGEMPKRRPESVMAWLNGKIMIALLIEKSLSRLTFSPKEGIGT